MHHPRASVLEGWRVRTIKHIQLVSYFKHRFCMLKICGCLVGLNVKRQRNAILAEGRISRCPQIAIRVIAQTLTSALPGHGW